MTRDPSRDRRVEAALAERFELVQFLGEGGFAAVYQVVNRKLGRIEALKVLHAGHTDEPDFALRFEQEARVAASLDHPSIVKIFDYGQSQELFWFTMQYVGGPTLAHELRQVRTFAPEVAARIASSILDALDYSHRRGVIHRDVKPENIILDDERRPYLMDFGIAKSEASLVRTQTGTVLGSPAYIAPEQLTGAPVDGRADLFALAVTLYRMISNFFPFYDEDAFRMATKRLTMPPRPLSDARPGTDPRLEAVVMRALAREPDGRFATAGLMRDSLQAYLTGAPEPAGASGPLPSAATAPSAPPSAVMEMAPTVRTTPRSFEAGAPAPSAAMPVSVSSAAPSARRRGPAVLTALVLAAIVAGGVLVTRRRSEPEPAVAPPTALPTALASVPAEPTAAPATPAPPTAAPSRVVPRPTAARREPTPEPPRRAVRLGPQPETVFEVPTVVSPEVARQFGDRPVGLSILIGPDGSVRSAKVISKLCPECDRAALEAVQKWKYSPPIDAEGKPIELRLNVSVMIPAQVP